MGLGLQYPYRIISRRFSVANEGELKPELYPHYLRSKRLD